MNRITGLAVALGLVVLSQSASAQKNCKDAKGTLIETTNEGTHFRGIVTHAGLLNGNSHGTWTGTDLLLSPAVFTSPIMDVFAHTFMIATNQGNLKATLRIFLYNNDTNQFVSVAYLDPVGSSGIFAGVTGVLFLNLLKQHPAPGQGFPYTFEQSIDGQICFAR